MTGGTKSKKKSKRIPNHKKYKGILKDNARARKVRKDKKKHPEKYQKSKDPGIPNTLPFKAAIIEEAKEGREQEMAHAKKASLAFKLRRKDEKAISINEGKSISDLVENAREKLLEFENRSAIKEATKEVLKDISAKQYYKEFKKVVDAADVLIEVLDSRDPLGTRCLPMEELIVNNARKKLVFLLNKADLVPKDNLQAWLKYLRREKPTVPFKATTQVQQSHLAQSKVRVTKSDHLASSKCHGADILMQLLKNYCRNEGIKTAITVGIIGLPNVGKSSVINSLKRSRACNVGNAPGVTKALQEILLDSKIRLLDSPGVILPGANVNTNNSCLRNAIKLENLDDYYGPVDAILKKASKDEMMLHYNLPRFEDTTEFLALMAQKTGKLKKKGISDVEIAARKVLQDWNSGRIKYYTRPPVIKETEVVSDIVTKLSKEFSLNEIESEENLFLENLPEHRVTDLMCVETSGPLTHADDGEEDNEGMEIEEDESSGGESGIEDDMLPANVEIDMSVVPEKKAEEPKKKKRWETKQPEIDLSKVCLRQLQKKHRKKGTKERNRNEKRAEELVKAFNSFEGVGQKDSYDFNDFFDKK